MNNKLPDTEIVKALECCIVFDNCENLQCPMIEECGKDIGALYKCTISLINRLQAENERLKAEVKFSDYMEYESINHIKAEAVKEFAERLKTEYAKGMNWFKKKESCYVDVGDIDNLLKEMVGDGGCDTCQSLACDGCELYEGAVGNGK